jgi:hypothetical protein
MNEPAFEAAGGEVAVWIDGGAICLKTCAYDGDPVEMAEHEAEELALVLLRLVKEMRSK